MPEPQNTEAVHNKITNPRSWHALGFLWASLLPSLIRAVVGRGRFHGFLRSHRRLRFSWHFRARAPFWHKLILGWLVWKTLCWPCPLGTAQSHGNNVSTARGLCPVSRRPRVAPLWHFVTLPSPWGARPSVLNCAPKS